MNFEFERFPKKSQGKKERGEVAPPTIGKLIILGAGEAYISLHGGGVAAAAAADLASGAAR